MGNLAATDLRTLVRDVLREALGKTGGAATESVRIASDADLSAFIARITEPMTLELVKSGKLRFTLGAQHVPAPLQASSLAGALTGVITEQKVDRCKGQETLVLAPDAVITPLARERARKLGLKIERRR